MTALFTAIGPKAQAAETPDAVPQALRGAWAAPDCAHYDEAVVLTRYFYLNATEDAVTLLPVRLSGAGENYEILDIAGTRHPAITTEDSLLIIGDMEGAGRSDWRLHWEDMLMTGRSEYTGCHDTPAIVPAPLIEAMKHADAVEAHCARAVTQACRALLFRAADGDGDGRLSAREFRHAGAVLSAFTPLAGGEPVPAAALKDAYERGAEEGAMLFAHLSALYDADGGGNLDMNEMARFTPGPDTPALNTLLEQASPLFPALAAE